MASPTYATDLNDLDTFEGATTDSEFTGYIAASKPDDSDTDFPVQGSAHVSAEQRTTGKGSIAVDNGSNITWTSGWNFFLWGIFLAPAAVNSYANDGIVMMAGSGTSDYYWWTVGGNDFGRYPYGGWSNFVIDPEVTTGRTQVGSPSGSWRWCGVGYDVISAISKGSPLGCDAIRYGRGQISAINGEAADYATFAGMAAKNDANDATNGYNRWGLFSYQYGSYIWKGLMSLGTTTAVDFRDANRNIVIDNTVNVQAAFNKIEINNASSNVEWTNINITALGTVSKGQFEMVDNATVSLDTCVFTDMSTFTFDSNATVTNCTFRRCGLVTGAGAELDGCLFEDATGTVALSESDLANVTDCTFNSDGSNNGIDLGTVSSTQSMNWNNYSIGHSGTTTNATIKVSVNTGITLTIVVGSGYDTPTVYNTGDGDVTISSDKTVTLTGLKDQTEVRVYPAATHPASFTINNISGSDADLQSVAAGDMPILAEGDEFNLTGCETSTNNTKWTVKTGGIVASGQEYRCTISTGTPTSSLTETGVHVNPITELAGTDDADDGTTDDRYYEFSLPAGTKIDYVIYNIDYNPIYTEDYAIPSANTSIPVQQVSDRWYYDEPE